MPVLCRYIGRRVENWGWGAQGQGYTAKNPSGNAASNNAYLSPSPVAGWSAPSSLRWASLSMGYSFTCGILKNGSAMCWYVKLCRQLNRSSSSLACKTHLQLLLLLLQGRQRCAQRDWYQRHNR